MQHPRATAIAAVVLCAALAVAGSASAHVGQPTLTAQHAFVGDPLWGLDSAEGTLLGLLPDERTAQASTTKLMTLHLTVLALNAGEVLLSDQVTINATEAGIGGSTMADINGVPLEEGEVVSLETLIRGMMYPSGNNAAWAIARHVAEAYLGVGATADDFVAMMNQHALDDGLVDTHFMNPNGFDDPYEAGVTPAPGRVQPLHHRARAREEHCARDPGSVLPGGRRVPGDVHRHDHGAPSGTKTYSWSWGFNYPGWEGAKGGGTQNCNGPNNGCMAMSAKRIGRRVVLAFMQGQPWTEEPGLFDYGFAQIFHPDARGTSLPVANVERQEIDCLTGERAVTAALTTSDGANVAVWDADVDASTLTKLGQAAVPSTQKGGAGGGKGPFEDVEVAAMPNGDFVVAVRKGANEELSWWTVTGGGSPTLVADGTKSGPAISLAIQPISSTRFLTVAVNPDNVLVLKSWELAGRLDHATRDVRGRVAALRRGDGGEAACGRHLQRPSCVHGRRQLRCDGAGHVGRRRRGCDHAPRRDGAQRHPGEPVDGGASGGARVCRGALPAGVLRRGVPRRRREPRAALLPDRGRRDADGTRVGRSSVARRRGRARGRARRGGSDRGEPRLGRGRRADGLRR